MRRRHRWPSALVWILALVSGGDAAAHINSPDLCHEGMAGPYRLLVTIRPPDVIPGVATVEVLAPGPDLRGVTLVPTPIHGPGAVSPPLADIAARDPGEPRLFRGRLWLMETGSWQVRVHADGPEGAGDLSVPVPALALRTRQMRPGLGVLLLGLLAFLFAGVVSIIGASVRDANLAPGATPDARRRRTARVAQVMTALLLVAAIAGGRSWWGSEAAFYGRLVYRPLQLAAVVSDGGSSAPTLGLSLTDPGWLPSRRLDDLLPDHGHLMHLFVVRLPGLDAIAHLHPTESAPGRFTQLLPALPAGSYQLFADIVHGNGLAETATTSVVITTVTHDAPLGDDAVGVSEPIAAANTEPGANDPVASLPDGTRVIWLRDRAGVEVVPLRSGQPRWFRFRVEDRDGAPARDLAPYMGMAGHAVFLAHDRSVFAHIHPSGSVPMAALALVAGTADPHAAHRTHPGALPAEVAFPYACPRPGAYRIFVQVKRGAAIETASFDARVR